MSKTVGNMLGVSKNATMSTKGASDWVNYLKNYDTSNVDNTLNNLSSYGYNASQNLNNMGNYNFNVEASDDARQRAEQASYNSAMNYLQPQFATQTSDLATALQNKGLAVGSEAYERAMNDLQNNQNQATNQAAFNAVQAGQNAYSQSLNDQINAGNFGNMAQQNYINQILSALQGSKSGYDINNDIYNAQTGIDKTNYQNQQNKNDYRAALTSSIMNAGASMAGSYFSDKRLKTNIEKICSVDDFNIYSFTYVYDDKPLIGVIAQEIIDLCPDAVIENYKGTEFYGVDYSKLPQKVINVLEKLNKE